MPKEAPGRDVAAVGMSPGPFPWGEKKKTSSNLPIRKLAAAGPSARICSAWTGASCSHPRQGSWPRPHLCVLWMGPHRAALRHSSESPMHAECPSPCSSTPVPWDGFQLLSHQGGTGAGQDLPARKLSQVTPLWSQQTPEPGASMTGWAIWADLQRRWAREAEIWPHRTESVPQSVGSFPLCAAGTHMHGKRFICIYCSGSPGGM